MAGAMGMRALLPDDATLTAWTTAAAAQTWASLDGAIWQAFAQELGDPNLDNLGIIGAMPPSIVRSALDSAQVAGVGLNPIARVKIGLIYNSCRQRYGMPLEDVTVPIPNGTWPVVAQSAPPGQAATNAAARVKVAMVMGQASSVEVDLLSEAEIVTRRRRYVTVMGEKPLPEEDVTDMQLSAFSRVCALGHNPYTDFGVWAPFGARLARELKFSAQYWNPQAGSWSTRELSGPDSIETWLKCYAVFKTAAIMESIATPQVIERYATIFKQRVERYRGDWALCVQAESRCRSEFWIQERRRQEAFHAEHPAMSSHDVTMPWNGVIKSATCSTDFWDQELKEPILFDRRHGHESRGRQTERHRSRSSRRPRRSRSRREDRKGKDRASRDHEGSDKAQKKKKGLTKNPDTKRGDGRYYVARNGGEICYVWSRNKDGCQTNCPHRRAHICEFCRTPHRTVNCEANPGWKPPAKDGGRDGGRGRASK